jgi:hypothetical protein
MSAPGYIKRVTRVPRDEAIWEVHYNGNSTGITRVVVTTIDTPGIGWKLNLFLLLRSSCIWKYGREDGPGAYRRFARELGIKGLRQQDGSYATIEEMEARTAQMVKP